MNLCLPCRRCSTTVSGLSVSCVLLPVVNVHNSCWSCVPLWVCDHAHFLCVCSLQPCMHCYCAGCYSGWMARASNCPEVHILYVCMNELSPALDVCTMGSRGRPARLWCCYRFCPLVRSVSIHVHITCTHAHSHTHTHLVSVVVWWNASIATT